MYLVKCDFSRLNLNSYAVLLKGHFDLPKLDTLFLTMPIAWKGTLAQYAGRLHREAVGKDLVTIFDYVDASLPMLMRMFKKREKGYQAMVYEVNFSRSPFLRGRR